MTLSFFQLTFVAILVLAITLVSLWLLTPVARAWHLVDVPNRRKLHQGEIPLIGGISVFLGSASGALFIFLFQGKTTPEEFWFWTISVVLLTIGIYDDSRDLSVRLRIVLQTLIALSLIYLAGLDLVYLGALLGPDFGLIDTGVFSVLFTLVAVIGIVNAFNMVDGIDGLLGGLAMIALVSILILAIADQAIVLSHIASLVLIALVPFLVCNLVPRLIRCPKVFMGDAGALFIGFTIAWLLIMGSQPHTLNNAIMNGSAVAATVPVFRPVTALWLVAIPLMDTINVMTRRIVGGRNPFKADREHLHHLLLRYGFSQRQSMAMIVFAATLFAAVGIAAEISQIAEHIMFTSFIGLFVVYYVLQTVAWRRV